MTTQKYILVAEDNHAYGSVYKRKLEREGFEVSVVEDGQSTLASVKKRRPDLLILDLLMPKLDGFEVLAKLKGSPNTRTIPVLVATNLSQDNDMEKAMNAGAVGYFIKGSISVSEMVAMVKQNLNLYHQSQKST